MVKLAVHELIPICPARLRIVLHLAIEAPDELHAPIKRWIDEQRFLWRSSNAGLVIRAVEPLSVVEEEDLFDNITDPRHVRLLDSYIPDLARWVLADTGGNFAKTVALLEEAEPGRWYDFYNRMKQKHGRQDGQAEVSQ